jgi:hypothetical protein
VPLWIALLAASPKRRKTVMGYISRLSGIPALIAIAVLGLVGTFLLSGWPFLRRVAWGGVALVAVLAAINEFRR